MKWSKVNQRTGEPASYCKANLYNCSECIYHEHVYDGVVFRGTRCLYREAEVMKALKGGETMVNRITRKIPVSSYKVKYTEEGKEREVVFETLSGLKTGEVISIAQTYINMYANPEKKIFVSPDIEETPHGVHIFETSLVKFLEIAYSVDVINHKED